MGLSENVVYPIVPNGFADHYPYDKWLYIIGNILHPMVLLIIIPMINGYMYIYIYIYNWEYPTPNGFADHYPVLKNGYI